MVQLKMGSATKLVKGYTDFPLSPFRTAPFRGRWALAPAACRWPHAPMACSCWACCLRRT